MKIKEISKKVITSFLLLAIMLIPTMVMAKEGDNTVNEEQEEHGLVNPEKEEVVKEEKEPAEENVVKEEQEPAEENVVKEEERLDKKDEKDEEERLDKKDEEGNLKASDIKLLEKIKFTGKLYKNYKCGADYGEYKEQIAVVTEISHRDDNVLGVTFIKSGKIISSFGYIKLGGEEGASKVEKAGKILSLKLDLFPKKEGAKIEINDKVYEINKNTNIELVNGGIKINDNFIKLEEGTIIKLVDLNAAFALDDNKTTNEPSDRFIINGNATFEITSDGFIVKGEVVLNGELVEGEAKVTFDNEKVEMKIIDAEIDGNKLNPTNFKTFLGNLITKIINFIKDVIKKILPF